MEVVNESDEYVIECLERALARAKRGELLGVAIIMETRAGSRSSWSTEDPARLGAAAYALMHHLLTGGMEEAEDTGAMVPGNN